MNDYFIMSSSLIKNLEFEGWLKLLEEFERFLCSFEFIIVRCFGETAWTIFYVWKL